MLASNSRMCVNLSYMCACVAVKTDFHTNLIACINLYTLLNQYEFDLAIFHCNFLISWQSILDLTFYYYYTFIKIMSFSESSQCLTITQTTKRMWKLQTKQPTRKFWGLIEAIWSHYQEYWKFVKWWVQDTTYYADCGIRIIR